MMKVNKSKIISFYELAEKWQKEAISNLDEHAEEAVYFEPSKDEDPEHHVLWDLNEAMRANGIYEGFKHNATITISNNSAMLLNISDDGEEAEYIYT